MAPVVANDGLFAGAVIVAVALAGTLKWMLAAATFTILVYYAITNFAALRTAQRAEALPGPDRRPGVGLLRPPRPSQRPITIASGTALLAIGFGLRLAIRSRAVRARLA